jgi:cysteine-rich repeat protein
VGLEECDDGEANGDAADLCRTNCKPPRCGDAILDPLHLETCDAGDALNTMAPDAPCRPNCQPPRCGDGVKDPTLNEVCDDGNVDSGDGCSADCRSDESCGNGILDPYKDAPKTGELCDEGGKNSNAPNANCRLDCTLAQCGDGIVDDFSEQCDNATANADLPDHCRANCTSPRCGDGIIDAVANAEVCDDTNNTPGDGCSFDCKSDETCGNGTIDYFADEQCDDGNLRNVDGCAANCRPETFEWRAEHRVAPAGRSPRSMTYDAARGRVVMFGGRGTGGYLNDTWEFDGTSWAQRSPTNAPPARDLLAMAFDAERVLLFGGSNGGNLGDTWEFDGTAWVRRIQDSNPTARNNHATAYDGGRGRVVLFGGFGNSGSASENLADTWEFDGVEWQQRQPSTAPSARNSHAMAYDGGRGRVVLFGGFGVGGGSGSGVGSGSSVGTLSDTWEFDGSTWTQRQPVAAPSARYGHAMTYDAARNRIVLFGGFSGWNLGDTWEFDGTTWTQRVLPASPPARNGHGLAYDAARRRVVLFGGSYASNGYYNDTWEYDGTTWTQRFVAPPPGRLGHAATDDVRRGRVVMFGGYGFASGVGSGSGFGSGSGSSGVWTSPVLSHLAETWEFDGASWIRRVPSSSPPGRSRHAMSYSLSRGRVVMFGGFAGGGGSGSTSAILDDTWEFDSTAGIWVQQVVPGPSARSRHAMAYDIVRDRVVVFGGEGASSLLGDTWEYTGAQTWVDVSLTGPPVRKDTAMAYDAARDRIVLFGGRGTNALFADTWEYNGVTWTQRFPGTSPSARSGHMMTYDTARRRIVLSGGSDGGNVGDTWEFDGTTWIQLAVSGPPARTGHVLAYDATWNRILMFGGDNDDPSSALADAWTLGYTRVQAGEVCSSGIDYDRDGAIGCDDDECWGTCAPTCPPDFPGTCTSTPRCGDGTCTEIENCRSCPGDCGACVPVCGDLFCDASETNCIGDCGP